MITGGILGLETEYAALVEDSGPANLDCLFESLEFDAAWDQATEQPWCDARGFVHTAQITHSYVLHLEVISKPDDVSTRVEDAPADVGEDEEPIHIETSSAPSALLPNGARFYLDHTHPEWCTPECATPSDLVAYDKVGEIWLHQQISQINADRPEAEHIHVYKNNVDSYGNTYGCHENYLVAADTYEDLFDSKAHRLYTVLIPFLVSRSIFCGAGKIAPLGDGDEMGFHISQRAGFIDNIIGLQTTSQRPLINTRDEPHADARQHRRMHIIVGDANLSEYATYLKVGTTALILEMLAADELRLDLTLVDPIRAIRQISEDTTCRVTVELETERRCYTAIDIQRCLLDAAERYLDERDEQGHQRAVWQEWGKTIDALAEDPIALSNRVDWVIKYQFLSKQFEAKGWDWSTPQTRLLDLQYHNIDPERSLFHLLQSKGLIDRLSTDEQLSQCIQQPPATRAHLRSLCLGHYPESIVAVNWDTLVFTTSQGTMYRWRLFDPTYGGDDKIEELLQGSESLFDFVNAVLGRKHNGSRPSTR